MPSPHSKPLVWLLEEATPDVALLMHQIERTGAGQADVQRVTYREALRDLPREAARGNLRAIVVFSLTNLGNLAALVKNLATPRPRLCFFPPNFEAIAPLEPAHRWPVAVSAVAHHSGEAAAFIASGFRGERVIRLNGDITPSGLPDDAPPSGRPLRLGFAWYNLAPKLREALTAEVARWHQVGPDRCEWHLFCMPGDEPDQADLPGVRVSGITAAAAACREPLPLDVWLADPWWPEAMPRPWRAPVTLHLPPGGASQTDAWSSRLQALMNLGDPDAWHVDALWAWAHQPIWKHLLEPDMGDASDAPREETGPGAAAVMPDLAPLVAARDHWHAWLATTRAAWETRNPEESDGSDLAYFFWIYDYRVEVSWCLDLWRALETARSGERHALIMAFNALRLHHANASWQFKRLLAATQLGRGRERQAKLGRSFWLTFIAKHPRLVIELFSTLWRCGRIPDTDPLPVCKQVAEAVLTDAKVNITRRNEPCPIAGVPTIYLLSHRHADLDPFLLLHVLPAHLAAVVGPRAQRWPLIGRLGFSSAFVLTGRERGVVIADAIAAVRARRALALYPEVTEPSYLGEGTPLRNGLLWIVQALERSAVIPVVLGDTFGLGSDGGHVDLYFGEPIVCTPDTTDNLLFRVRQFFHLHVAKLNDLDSPEIASRGLVDHQPPT